MIGHDDNGLLASALRTIEIEQAGIAALTAAMSGKLGREFTKALALFREPDRRLILTGIGKSGLIARKVAATFSSTGTPSYFLHAAEASHGDLGLISSSDVVVAFSWSGETIELRNVVEYALRFRVPLVAVTSNAGSALGRVADVTLELPAVVEACPNGLAPTTSTTLQLVVGDAMAVALLQARGFTASDFRIFHPGGKLGSQLRTVGELMHAGDQLPLVSGETLVADAIIEMTSKRFGTVGVVDQHGRLAGIVTDGDLRRTMAPDLLQRAVGEIMTPSPRIVSPETTAGEALNMMNTQSITALFVVDKRQVCGILHIHDLLRVGVS